MENEKNMQSDIPAGMVEAFHMMWDMHPSPVMLTKANHTVLAVNPAGQAAGIFPEQKCYTLCGPTKPCSSCMAHSALKDNLCQRRRAYYAKIDKFLDTYWTPVAGVNGYYVHYANDITECVKEDLLKDTED